MTGAPGDPALAERIRAAAVGDLRMTGDAVDRATVTAAAERVMARERLILGGAERARLLEDVADAALGLGPLERLMRDPEVTEIMVCRHDRVFVERAGRVEPAEAAFLDAAHVLHVVDRILAPLGRRVDESSPMVDARLADGSRVNVVVPPLAVDGPAVTIRRFGARPLAAADLVARGTLTEDALALLREAVAARRNVLVTGGTGSGKTTTLAALAGAIPDGERVVTIEDAAELRLPLPHVVRLESRPASLEGRGAVPIRALVRNALRMRPDRIVVGEVRGGEAPGPSLRLPSASEGRGWMWAGSADQRRTRPSASNNLINAVVRGSAALSQPAGPPRVGKGLGIEVLASRARPNIRSVVGRPISPLPKPDGSGLPATNAVPPV